MQLKDSGSRREFNTGAVRDIATGKGRCDLLPLNEIAVVLGDPNLSFIDDYLRKGTVQGLYSVVICFIDEYYPDPQTALLELAKHYEDGANKYEERNWEIGIPLHCYIDSGVRHYLKFLRGDKDEPHNRAFLWNMLGAIWTHENKPEMIDLPFLKEVDNND